MLMPGMETTTRTDPGSGGTRVTANADLAAALETFLAQRTRLFRVARRITGDAGNAEDVVQEAWLRWQRADRQTVENPAAFLTTTTTHLAINAIQTARHRHESPAESPLHDLVDPVHDPTLHAERAAAAETTLFVLMAKLSPAGLAAYVLRRGFDYPYGEIAGLLGTTQANARQLVRRAQQRIEGDRRGPVSPDAHRLLVTAFSVAARTGDLTALEDLLTRDARESLRMHPHPPARPARPPRVRVTPRSAARSRHVTDPQPGAEGIAR